jgi:hypothetical protein
MHPAFQYSQFLLRRQVLALTGKFRLYNPAGELVLFSQQKMFRLREDIRVFTDESRSQEVLWIQARQIIDFSAAYDVLDTGYNTRLGALRRRGWRSLLQDEWEVLDANDHVIGLLREDNLTRAMLRRFLLASFLPQDYDLTLGETRVADLRQRFNPLRYEMDVTLLEGAAARLDPRLVVAAAILLATIEGRQSS